MNKELKLFISKHATENDLCYNYLKYPKEIQQVLKNIYSCCFRFGLYTAQILFVLNKTLEPIKLKSYEKDMFGL